MSVGPDWATFRGVDVGQPLFYSVEEDWFDKLGEEGIDKGSGCCVVKQRRLW